MAYDALLSSKLSKLRFGDNSNDQNVGRDRDAIAQVLRRVKVSDSTASHLLASYLNDIWLCEFPPPKSFDTIGIVDRLLKPGEKILPFLSDVKNPEVLEQTLVNLHAATTNLFGKDFRTPISPPLTIEFVQDLHRIIGRDVIRDCGTFRTKFVHAYGSSVAYALPKTIDCRLKSLIAFVNQRQKEFLSLPLEQRTVQLILLGSLFFSEFLLIHPFIDGNGRTARLLLNFILKDITVVPFSLYLTDRSEYVNVLEARSLNQQVPRHALARYVLWCMGKTCSDIAFLEAEVCSCFPVHLDCF